MYNPDKWVVIKINGKEPHYRVFGSWYGGFAGSDSWRMNSGIVSVESDEHTFKFSGSSGSVYNCHKRTYGTSGYSNAVLNDIMSRQPELDIEILPEDTDFMNLEYK
jgi:hypothetical protein